MESALELLPLSRDVYLTACRQLLPRWHGNYELLRELTIYAYNKTKERCDDMMFLTVLDIINYHEDEIDMCLVPPSHILQTVADRRSTMKDDYSLTVACGFYCWLEQYDRVTELMPQIGALNLSFWYYDKNPRISVSQAYLMQQ